MEIYGLSKTKQFLAPLNGICPVHTFRRVFERINPKVFERCFQRWVQSIVETLGHSNLLMVRPSFLRQRTGEIGLTPCVSAWASEHRLALGQVKVADKSNEITAIPALELPDLITIDAMGTTNCNSDI